MYPIITIIIYGLMILFAVIFLFKINKNENISKRQKIIFYILLVLVLLGCTIFLVYALLNSSNKPSGYTDSSYVPFIVMIPILTATFNKNKGKGSMDYSSRKFLLLMLFLVASIILAVIMFFLMVR